MKKRRTRGRWLKRNLKKLGRRFGMPSANDAKIKKYIDELPVGAELRVVFGGHWSDNPGWLIMNEKDQDITDPLSFATSSVDVVFSEHVIEHIPFVSAIYFFRETFRILKPGGSVRVVCPMLDVLRAARLEGERGRRYLETVLDSWLRRREGGLGGAWSARPGDVAGDLPVQRSLSRVWPPVHLGPEDAGRRSGEDRLQAGPGGCRRRGRQPRLLHRAPATGPLSRARLAGRA